MIRKYYKGTGTHYIYTTIRQHVCSCFSHGPQTAGVVGSGVWEACVRVPVAGSVGLLVLTFNRNKNDIEFLLRKLNIIIGNDHIISNKIIMFNKQRRQ
jgi:hypothetical protein